MQRPEDANDRLIMTFHLGLQLLELRFQGVVGDEHLPHVNERSHDLDIDCDGALAIQHGGQHGDALFSECQRQIATATMPGT